MKKLFLIVPLLFANLLLKAQSETFNQLQKIIYETHPEKNLSQKLIGVVFWSAKDSESQSLLKEFEKNVSIYQNARLKDASKGIEMLAINLDNLNPESIALLKKLEITQIIPSTQQAFGTNEFKAGDNIIFNSAGVEVYRNLKPSQVFSSFNKLITR